MGAASQFKVGGVPGGVRQLLNVQTLTPLGSTVADAAQITTKGPAIVYATGADGTKGIKLPKAVPGKMYIVVNRDSDNAVLKVYPFEAAGIINGLSAAAAISMAAKTRAIFVCVVGGASSIWSTLPLLPS